MPTRTNDDACSTDCRTLTHALVLMLSLAQILPHQRIWNKLGVGSRTMTMTWWWFVVEWSRERKKMTEIDDWYFSQYFCMHCCYHCYYYYWWW